MRTVHAGLLGLGLGVNLALGLSMAVPMTGAASDQQVVELRDDCDPATFNAVLGPGACIGSGTTTFSDFIAELREDKVASDWVFDPDQVTIHQGNSLAVQNTGGEVPTFPKGNSFVAGLGPFFPHLSR